jgi:hypothetical protein
MRRRRQEWKRRFVVTVEQRGEELSARATMRMGILLESGGLMTVVGLGVRPRAEEQHTHGSVARRRHDPREHAGAIGDELG